MTDFVASLVPFSSHVFSSISLSDSPIPPSAEWPYSALFTSLGKQMKKDAYQWEVLMSIKQIMIGADQRDNNNNNSNTNNNDISNTTERLRKEASILNTTSKTVVDEEENEEEEIDEADESISDKATVGDIASSSSSSLNEHDPLDDLLLCNSYPHSSFSSIDPISQLLPHQSHSFKLLAALIREHLSYLPVSPPLPNKGNDNENSAVSTEASNTPSSPAIAVPRQADILGLFFISLLVSAPSKPFAYATILLIELLGSLCSLQLTIKQLFQITQKHREIELPPNKFNTVLEGLDVSTQSSTAFIPSYLSSSSFIPIMIVNFADNHHIVDRYELRPVIYKLLSAILTNSASISSSSFNSLSKSPTIWYQFTDTPLFPKVARLSPPAASAVASSPSIHTHGYSWITYLSLTGIRDPNNIFRFFNDTGFGLQCYLRGNSICMRTLPNTGESFVLKGFDMEEGAWVHVAITHKPLPKVNPPSQLRRPSGLSGTQYSGYSSPGSFASPTGTGAFAFIGAGSSSSPTPPNATSPMSPTSQPIPHHTRPGKLTLYINGIQISVNDIPYPNLENSDHLQCTLGGLYGRMSSFFLFADVLAPAVISSLYALGAGQYAIPAMHVVNAGLVAVFPPPPSITSYIPQASTPTLNPNNPRLIPNPSRTVARSLLAQSPAQTTHSVCLPFTWPEGSEQTGTGAASNAQAVLAPSTATSTINQCLHHTLRLDGITVVYRVNNTQTLAVLGGMKLFIIFSSPSYYGHPYKTDADITELLILLASLMLTNESHAHLLLEIGAAAVKQLFLDHCKRRHKTMHLLAAIRKLLLAVNLVDHTAEQSHFAAFTSALLLDFTYWRNSSSIQVQHGVVRLIRMLVTTVQSPFLAFHSIGVPRIIDNIRVIYQPYLFSGNAATGIPAAASFSSPSHGGMVDDEDKGGFRDLFSPSLSFSSTPHVILSHMPSVPSIDESNMTTALIEIALTLAKNSISSPAYERDCVAPFIHLIQCCQSASQESCNKLLTDLLSALITIISFSTHRVLTYLYQQQCHYIFLRLLYTDDIDIRVLGLKLLGYLNVHCIRMERLERDKKLQIEYNQLQADIAQAVISALGLFTVSAAEHDCLFHILMGQSPDAPIVTDEKATVSLSAIPSHAQPFSLEAGVAFCHPAYLNMVLELSLLSPINTQCKVLLDVLTLLRTNAANVDGLAALFWQRLLLPFSSRMHYNPALAAFGSMPYQPNSPVASSSDESPSATPQTVDQLVHQIMNLMLLHCMVNEPKGWQVFDQSIWCLQEKNSLLAAMPPQIQQAAAGHVTLSKTVHDTWLLEMSILYRLFHSLQRYIKLLSGRKERDGALASTPFNEQQLSNLKNNMTKIFELAEWILFHSPCSFLTAPTQLALGVPNIDMLPVATRADNNIDDATRDEAVRAMLAANVEEKPRENRDNNSIDDLPGGDSGSSPLPPSSISHPHPLTVDVSNDPGDNVLVEYSVTSIEQPEDMDRSVSAASTASAFSNNSLSSNSSFNSSSTASSSSQLRNDPLPSSATILRASQRNADEPLTAEEIEIFTLLLTGVIEQFPITNRQDILRVMFRFLMVVLPHPLCSPLIPVICDMTRLLFTDRITERLEKNTRLVALSLSLLKTGMESGIRRQDLQNVELIKRCIGQLYAAWGEIVFMENFTNPQALAGHTLPTGSLRAPIAQPLANPVAGAFTLAVATGNSNPSATSPSVSLSTSPASAHFPANYSPTDSSSSSSTPTNTNSSSPPPTDPIEESTEAALFRLYQGDGRNVIEATQTVFLQHQQRFSYISEVRAAKVHASIVDYLRRKRSNEAAREKKFSLGSTIIMRQAQAAKPFLLSHYLIKKNRCFYRPSEREEKQLIRVNKAIKQFRAQMVNSRPLPLPVPICTLPTLTNLLARLQATDRLLQMNKEVLNLGSSSSSSFNLRYFMSHSTLIEYWKLDSTESPTRMRKLLKKNFGGNPHTYASANAVTNAQKQMQKANEAIDLMKVNLAASNIGESTGVDVNATDEDKDKETKEEREKAKEKLLLTAEAEDAEEDTGEDETDTNATDRVDDGEDDDLDDETEDDRASNAAKVKRSSKVLLSHFATMITPTHKFIGTMKVSTSHISFTGIEQQAPPATDNQPKPEEGEEKKKKKPKLKEKHIRWSLKQLRMVLPRFFLLRESALEVFLNNFKNYFFNFTPLPEGVLLEMGQAGSVYSSFTSSGTSFSAQAQQAKNRKWRSGREQRNEVYKLLCTLVPDMQYELSPGRRLLKSGIMKAWQRGEVSNFDYLMHLNTIAGRSYNDINQYPVFPWILTDYKSSTMDLNNPAVYRDLSQPIGALNEDRFEIFKERFDTFEDDAKHAIDPATGSSGSSPSLFSLPAFMYGSHYSSAGIALHYLIRMEPFTSLAISLQGGRFDLPDRLFDSISGSWDLSYNNMADVKELIPEFFYQPDFLRNVNHLDLGTKQDKQKLGDVILPPWAASPEEFVRINRQALESDYVSSHLHEWIDLIFGFKQKGKAAVDAKNVFFYLTYAGSVDIDAIEQPSLRKATEDQIANFGQTPIQLLTSPHPKRLSAAERNKAALGYINLPLRLPYCYTSQLVCNYQGPPKRKKSNSTIREDRPDDDRSVLEAKIPISLAFTYHDVIITVTPSMAIQSHALSTFLSAPPTLLYPAHEQMQPAWQGEGESVTGSTIRNEPNSPAVEPKPLTVNKRGAHLLIDPFASLLPTGAQFVPSSILASHVLSPMCPHWFLSPVQLPSSMASSPATPSTGSSSAEQKSRALAPHSGSERYYPVVCQAAKNAKFLFTGGYFDGSLKCHALVHYKAHVEGEGGMAGQQSHHIMAALAAKSEHSLNLQRPSIKTQSTVDIKPLSTIRQHQAVITAMGLSANQIMLLTGDEDGVVMIWRTYLDRQERSRPPLASSPIATFSVHEGPVIAVDTNTVVGIAISLAQDIQKKRGCEVNVYSIRGGSARFMRSIVLHDPSINLSLCTLTANANIVLYGNNGKIPTLWLYSLNGFLLTSVSTNDVLSVLMCTPNTSRTVNANDGFVLTGGRRGQIVFRSPHNLDPVQTFFTDDQFPHSIPHGLPALPTAFVSSLPQTHISTPGHQANLATPNDYDPATESMSSSSPPLSISPPYSSLADAATDEWMVIDHKQPEDPAKAAEAQRLKELQETPDPTLESIYNDPTLNLLMGIAAIDISRTQKHFIVSVYPDPDLLNRGLIPASHPYAYQFSAASTLGTSEGRLLLFPLPFSADPLSFLGFYVDYAASTIENMRDSVSAAMLSRIGETRDLALESVDKARDRLGREAQHAGKKINEVKSKVFGAFNSLFGNKKTSTNTNTNNLSNSLNMPPAAQLYRPSSQPTSSSAAARPPLPTARVIQPR